VNFNGVKFVVIFNSLNNNNNIKFNNGFKCSNNNNNNNSNKMDKFRLNIMKKNKIKIKLN
jgi:hypothetical protein